MGVNMAGFDVCIYPEAPSINLETIDIRNLPKVSSNERIASTKIVWDSPEEEYAAQAMATWLCKKRVASHILIAEFELSLALYVGTPRARPLLELASRRQRFVTIFKVGEAGLERVLFNEKLIIRALSPGYQVVQSI